MIELLVFAIFVAFWAGTAGACALAVFLRAMNPGGSDRVADTAIRIMKGSAIVFVAACLVAAVASSVVMALQVSSAVR